jgi:hypothetical protein
MEPRASVVFAVRWPFATHATVEVRSDTPIDLRMGRRSLLGSTVWYEVIHVTAKREFAAYRVPVPDGGFDSGINEILFEYDGIANVTLRSIQYEDAQSYPPPP